jgi:sulfatase maturation enzyme AslB (radical SAM superfamily)
MNAIEVTTTVGCRIRCDYCPQDKLVRAYHSLGGATKMSLETYQNVLKKLPPGAIIHFSGMSEPWLNPDCTEMVLHTHERGYEVAVFTTAVGMDVADVEKIRSIPFGHFVVHLPDTERYAKIDVNEPYLKTLDYIVKSFIRNCEFMTMGTLPPDVRKIIGKRIAPTRMMARAGNVTTMSDIQCPPRLAGPIRCRSCGDAMNHNILLPNGDVVLCCMDYGLQHVLGNLLLTDYESLFHGEVFKQLRQGLDDDSSEILCRYCDNASPLEEYNQPEKKKGFGRLGKALKNLITPTNRKCRPAVS